MEKSIFFDATLYAYLSAAILYTVWLLKKQRSVGHIGTGLLLLGVAFHTVFIVQRWVVAGYPPFSNTFETLVFFSWLIVIQYLVVEVWLDTRFLGSGASFLALIILAYSTLFPSAVRPLMPALQNNFWLTVHVILCFISYAAFALSFLVALLYLIRRPGWHGWAALFLTCLIAVSLIAGMLISYLHKMTTVVIAWNAWTGVQLLFGVTVLSSLLWFPLFWLIQKKTWAVAEETLEALVYKIITFAFPFLTMGILAGAVWANEAWGTYWGWDPKETWSLITWFIYALYLHSRYMKGWKGPVLAWFAVVGFLAVIFTYFGVNYLLAGLHSYA